MHRSPRIISFSANPTNLCPAIRAENASEFGRVEVVLPFPFRYTRYTTTTSFHHELLSPNEFSTIFPQAWNRSWKFPFLKFAFAQRYNNLAMIVFHHFASMQNFVFSSSKINDKHRNDFFRWTDEVKVIFRKWSSYFSGTMRTTSR